MSLKSIGKDTILIAEDDQAIRLLMRRSMERDGYQVLEASTGKETIRLFETEQPDIVIMDCMMPETDGIEACARIQKLPGGKETPVLMVTALHDDDIVNRAFEAGASDYLTKPLHWPILRYRIQRLLKAKNNEDHLRQLIDDMNILHRIDRELGYTLDIKRVLDLTMDTAVRRTAASACVIGWVREGTQILQRISSIGRPSILIESIGLNELATTSPMIARLFAQGKKDILETQVDERHVQLLIPLMMQGKPQGIIGLEKVPLGLYTQADFDFLVYLASRTADALEKTQIYQSAQLQAAQMQKLYETSSIISSRLNRSEVMELGTRGMTVLMNGAGAFFCEYEERSKTLTVRKTFRIEGIDDTLPPIDNISHMDQHPEILHRLTQGPMQISFYDSTMTQSTRDFVRSLNLQQVLLVPLKDKDDLLGVIGVLQKPGNYFLPNEITLALSLAGQTAVALQNATLFSNVQELEQIKSEMIRMASHDLRNPLTQISGYLHLLNASFKDGLNEQQDKFLQRIKRGTERMQSLLEDILNLEKIESHQVSSWAEVNLRVLVNTVSSSLKPQVDLKNQDISVNTPEENVMVWGNNTQIQQALNNLINNAIKYTPDEGKVMVRLYAQDDRALFEVEDTGYGIPEDRQLKLFERFYRAHAPGTEDIEGTGLGLSLVKTVIEKHGGQVWFKSQVGQGSTFGFWLPLFKKAMVS